MKNPNSKRNKINIIFSSFLVIGYIVCTYFFSSLASQVAGTWGSLIQILILLVFGLLLFYATRVGEGRQVKRFSLAVLLLIDIPALYIIIASLVPNMPLHDMITPAQSTMSLLGVSTSTTPSIILMMACIALGYGIPYTFFAGYEMADENAVTEEDAVVEGGLAEELAQTEDNAEEQAETAEEAVEENAEEAVEETVEDSAEEAIEEIAEEAAAEEAAEEAVEEIKEEAAEKAEETTEEEAE